MKKDFEEISDEIKDLFKERINQKMLDGIKWGITSNDNLKKTKDNMCALVIFNKPAQAAQYGEDILFVVNEFVFGQLQQHTQIIIVDKLLAQISYDLDKGVVKKSSPDILEHSGILLQYKFDLLQASAMEVNQIYEKMKEDNTKNDNSSTLED